MSHHTIPHLQRDLRLLPRWAVLRVAVDPFTVPLSFLRLSGWTHLLQSPSGGVPENTPPLHSTALDEFRVQAAQRVQDPLALSCRAPASPSAVPLSSGSSHDDTRVDTSRACIFVPLHLADSDLHAEAIQSSLRVHCSTASSTLLVTYSHLHRMTTSLSGNM